MSKNHHTIAYLPPKSNLVRPEPREAYGEHAIPNDSAAERQYFAAAMEARRESEAAQEFKAVRRGWCLGDKGFRKELLAQMHEQRGPNHYGEERFESDEANALAILDAELKRGGWQEQELQTRRKGDKHKVQMAGRLRRETTMTLKWIADRLAMGSWSNAANLLAASHKAIR